MRETKRRKRWKVTRTGCKRSGGRWEVGGIRSGEEEEKKQKCEDRGTKGQDGETRGE